MRLNVFILTRVRLPEQLQLRKHCTHSTSSVTVVELVKSSQRTTEYGDQYLISWHIFYAVSPNLQVPISLFGKMNIVAQFKSIPTVVLPNVNRSLRV